MSTGERMPVVGEGGSLNFAAMNRFDELVAGGKRF